jgi:hypothetical protein
MNSCSRIATNLEIVSPDGGERAVSGIIHRSSRSEFNFVPVTEAISYSLADYCARRNLQPIANEVSYQNLFVSLFSSAVTA